MCEQLNWHITQNIVYTHQRDTEWYATVIYQGFPHTSTGPCKM